VNNLRWGSSSGQSRRGAWGGDIRRVPGPRRDGQRDRRDAQVRGCHLRRVTAWQVLKGLLTPVVEGGPVRLGLAADQPGHHVDTGIALAVTLLMTLWNRFKGRLRRTWMNSTSRRRIKRPRSTSLSSARPTSGRRSRKSRQRRLFRRSTPVPNEGVRYPADERAGGLAPAVDDEKKWSRRCGRSSSTRRRYKEIADLYKKNDWAKEDILEALGKAQESEKAEIAKRMDEQETNLKNSQKVIEDDSSSRRGRSPTRSSGRNGSRRRGWVRRNPTTCRASQ